MYQELPCDTSLEHYEFTVRLDGLDYRFRFRWNERAERWVMSILAADGTPLLMGRRVVANWPFLFRFKNLALPPGELYSLDTSGAGIDPGRYDLGGRVKLYYFEKADIGLARFPT